MAKQVLSKKIETFRKHQFYSILYGKVTDCCYKEQLSFNIQTVDGNVNTHEDFSGFYEVHNIKKDTIVAAIKDITSHLSSTMVKL